MARVLFIFIYFLLWDRECGSIFPAGGGEVEGVPLRSETLMVGNWYSIKPYLVL